MLHDPQQSELFPKLTGDELERLTPHGTAVSFQPGETLFTEGEPATDFYVLIEGQVRVTRSIGGEEQLLTIHGPGEFTGELSMLTGGSSQATGRAVGTVSALKIESTTFRTALAECSHNATIIITAMAGRARDLEAQLRQQEKLAALGKLSAGLAHELNNPAAAGRRAAVQLREALVQVQSRLLEVCEELFPVAQRQALLQLQQEALAHAECSRKLLPLERSDLEDSLADWLDDHGIGDGYKLAPVLVSAGITGERLEGLASRFEGEALAEGLRWLHETLSLVGLVGEVEHSTTRISQLVKAIKSYTYMDQSPLQEVDVHEGLENTLTILNHKLKYGVEVDRQFAPDLPRICAHGSELNQVWTNLIDNAIDAMAGKGKLVIRTSRLANGIQVEIIDSGSGIPPKIQARIFEPFFTTKAMGEGSGLGLDIVRRIVQHHKGWIRVDSSPGRTCFRVGIPGRPDQDFSESPAAAGGPGEVGQG